MIPIPDVLSELICTAFVKLMQIYRRAIFQSRQSRATLAGEGWVMEEFRGAGKIHVSRRHEDVPLSQEIA